MSRAYRIRVGEATRRVVHVEDGVSTTLELLTVLPRERMSELLAAELERQGFRRDEGTLVRVEPDGVAVTVELATGTVTVGLVHEQEVEVHAERVTTSTNDNADRRAEVERQLRQRVAADLDEGVDRERERLAGEVAARLERRLRDLQRELDGVVNRTTAGALKERAAQIGEIEEVVEDEKTGSITIKVKV